MYKLDQVSADSGKSHCLTRVLFKELFFVYFESTRVLSKKDICSCIKELSVVGGQAFFSSFKKDTEVLFSSSVDSESELD